MSKNNYRLIKEVGYRKWEIQNCFAEDTEGHVEFTINGSLKKAIKKATKLEKDWETSTEYGLKFKFKKKPRSKSKVTADEKIKALHEPLSDIIKPEYTKWEYMEVRGLLSLDDLNEFGRDGWELSIANHYVFDKYIYTFKRPIYD